MFTNFHFTVKDGIIKDKFNNDFITSANAPSIVNGIDGEKSAFSTTGGAWISPKIAAYTFSGNEDFTIYSWVKCEAASLLPILLGTGNPGQGLMVGATYYADGIYFDYSGYGNNPSISFAASMRNNEFNNVVLTKKQDTLNIFLAGIKVKTVQIPNLTISFPAIIIGWDNCYANRVSTYTIQEIGMYNSCLFDKDFVPTYGKPLAQPYRLYGKNSKLYGYK